MGACCPGSLSSAGAVLLHGEPMTRPCCVRKVTRFGELGGLGNSNGGMALEGEPRMVGRGLRCISSLSLGDECRGRTVIRPVEGATTGSECCFLIFCLPPPLAHSNKQGALWSREPSPVVCGCW